MSHVWTGTTQAQSRVLFSCACACVFPVHTWLMLVFVLVLVLASSRFTRGLCLCLCSCLCLRRPGSHVAYACACACACVVRVKQPFRVQTHGWRKSTTTQCDQSSATPDFEAFVVAFPLAVLNSFMTSFPLSITVQTTANGARSPKCRTTTHHQHITLLSQIPFAPSDSGAHDRCPVVGDSSQPRAERHSNQECPIILCQFGPTRPHVLAASAASYPDPAGRRKLSIWNVQGMGNISHFGVPEG